MNRKGEQTGRLVTRSEATGSAPREAARLLPGLFDWTIDADNALGESVVPRETNFEGVGVGGGIRGSWSASRDRRGTCLSPSERGVELANPRINKSANRARCSRDGTPSSSAHLHGMAEEGDR